VKFEEKCEASLLIFFEQQMIILPIDLLDWQTPSIFKIEYPASAPTERIFGWKPSRGNKQFTRVKTFSTVWRSGILRSFQRELMKGSITF
jgi:hypothetical protein